MAWKKAQVENQALTLSQESDAARGDYRRSCLQGNWPVHVAGARGGSMLNRSWNKSSGRFGTLGVTPFTVGVSPLLAFLLQQQNSSQTPHLSWHQPGHLGREID